MAGSEPTATATDAGATGTTPTAEEQGQDHTNHDTDGKFERSGLSNRSAYYTRLDPGASRFC